MDSLLEILALCLGGSGLSGIIVACLNRHWSKKDSKDERMDHLVDAQKVIMIDRVRWLGKKYIEAGEVELADKENIKDMYKAYKSLGGNGHLDTVMEEIEHLKVI